VYLPNGAFMTAAGVMPVGLPGDDGFEPSKGDPAKVRAAFAK
jgi:hypothetical protein